MVFHFAEILVSNVRTVCFRLCRSVDTAESDSGVSVKWKPYTKVLYSVNQDPRLVSYLKINNVKEGEIL